MIQAWYPPRLQEVLQADRTTEDGGEGWFIVSELSIHIDFEGIEQRDGYINGFRKPRTVRPIIVNEIDGRELLSVG